MIRVAVAGAMGRMGRCVLELAARDPQFTVAAALTARGCQYSGTQVRIADQDVLVVESLEAECDVLIDFSTAAGTTAWLEVCERREIPMVIGVTGHDAGQTARIREAAHQIPIIHSANFSVGVNALLGLVGPLAQMLGEEFDVEIVETHHRNKVDAPSGTALAFVRSLREAVRSGRGQSTDDRANDGVQAPPRVSESSNDGGGSVIHGRSGKAGPRPKGEIAVHAVRMGDVVGEHEIHMSGCGETITLRHTALSREAFGAGALCAARWLVSRRPGFYTMRDVLGAAESPAR